MKKRLSLFFASTLLLAGLGQVANAQEVYTGTSEASIEFSKGELSLEPVNPIDFGSYEIGENTSGIFPAENAQTVTVNDFRGNPEGDWYLTASISEFTGGALPGFDLVFTEGSKESDPTENVLEGPEVVNTPYPTLDYVEGEDGSAPFLTATDGEGRGSWTGTWSSVVLNIPIGAESVGEHVATITWELKDAPQ